MKIAFVSNSAFTNYGQLRASFSGAGNDRGLVLVDGIPAQDGFGGQIDWQAYPPNDIQFAELLRGAGVRVRLRVQHGRWRCTWQPRS